MLKAYFILRVLSQSEFMLTNCNGGRIKSARVVIPLDLSFRARFVIPSEARNLGSRCGQEMPRSQLRS
jgi:hypothetical protein